MELLFAENIRKLRCNRGLTQNDLAGFLGISPQSVSKWERNEGLPDITILPSIAAYFSVSIDDLIGNPLSSKDEKIKMYTDEYERLRMSGNVDAADTLAEQAYCEYPYDWKIITIYCNSLTRGYSIHPGEKLPELRSLCKMVIDKCTDAETRKFAVYSMLFAEDDDKVEYWFGQVPGTYDFTCWERREERYQLRGFQKEYIKQKQSNIFTLYTYMDDKMCKDIESPRQGVVIYKQRVDIAKALTPGAGGYFGIAFKEIMYAGALFANKNNEEGYSILEEAVSILKKWFAIPEGSVMTFEGAISEYSYVKKPNSNERNIKSVLRALKERNDYMFGGFTAVRNESRFQKLVCDIESLVMN